MHCIRPSASALVPQKDVYKRQLMGLLIIVLFYRSAKEHDDAAFRWMWLTIVLSFGFYIPVVLWANTVPMIGMLMILSLIHI